VNFLPKFFSKTFKLSIIFYSTWPILVGGQCQKACRSRKKESKQSEITQKQPEPVRSIFREKKRICTGIAIWPPPPPWNSDRNSFENEAFSTKTSNPLRVYSLLKEFFGHCSCHNVRTNSLLFSILEMLLTGSDCFHVISDCFDSFFRDLHAFRLWPRPEICSVE